MPVIQRENDKNQLWALQWLDDKYAGGSFDAVTVDGTTGKAQGQMTLAKTLNAKGGIVNAGDYTGTGAEYHTNPLQPISDPYTVGTSEYIVVVDSSAGNVAITLPPAASMYGRVFRVLNIGSAHNAVMTPTGSDSINGANSTLNVAYAHYNTFFAAGPAGWFVIG